MIKEIDDWDFEVIKKYCEATRSTAHFSVDPAESYPIVIYTMKDGKITFQKSGVYANVVARELAYDLNLDLHKGTHPLYKPRNI